MIWVKITYHPQGGKQYSIFAKGKSIASIRRSMNSWDKASAEILKIRGGIK
jgi:hypothetical protein